MPKIVSALELSLGERRLSQNLTDWLYGELRSSILERRLAPGTRLPASRDFARQYGVSRGTVVSVFERLQSEGYLSSQVGSGTWVNDRVKTVERESEHPPRTPAYVQRVIDSYSRPKAFVGLERATAIRPFQMRDPALSEFPVRTWANLMARRARGFDSWLRTEDDGRGFRPLREAIAQYLSSSRGVRCTPAQIVVVSGVQQALDLLARLLLKPGDPVWLEDPGYFGASIAFNNAGARIVPVRVDQYGLSVAAGMKRCRKARGVYLTPAHQFPLGMTMPLERRLEVLRWASDAGAFVIEDDYDSEYRFEGQPVPALQSLDRESSVILIGSFTKLLFPSLRLGYVVLPESLVDYFIAYRFRTDLRSLKIEQAVLCDFITTGHLGRHLRRMRNIYAGRLRTLLDESGKQLGGLLEISGVQAGLYTAGWLRNRMGSREAETIARAHGIDAVALDRYTIDEPDPRGLLLGFAAFDDAAIRIGVAQLAAALRPVRR
jgi:GntR family transcriptional regulator/MocR family aminotransferase